MSKLTTPESIIQLPTMLIKNMISLATSGFGVMVALAWNEAIKSGVNNLIQPYFGQNSSVISLFIYAGVVTILAVVVTMQLTNLEKSLEKLTTNSANQVQAKPAKQARKLKTKTVASKINKSNVSAKVVATKKKRASK